MLDGSAWTRPSCRARALWIRGEASADESCDWSAAFSRLELRALCVAESSAEVQPQHGQVHEDDAGEQEPADDDPGDRRRAERGARP